MDKQRTKSTNLPRVEASCLRSVPSRRLEREIHCAANTSDLSNFLVLPVWIEHTTSPLPRGCSTTELRQQVCAATGCGGVKRGGNCHTLPGDARRRLQVATPGDRPIMPRDGKREARQRQKARQPQPAPGRRTA